jgi:hypothetical protein
VTSRSQQEWQNRRHGRPTAWKTDGFSKTCAHQLSQNRALIPPFEGSATHFRIVNLNAFLDVLSRGSRCILFRTPLTLIEYLVAAKDAPPALSLLPQQRHGINAQRALRRDPGCDEAEQRHCQHHARQYHRVARRGLVHNKGQHPACQ